MPLVSVVIATWRRPQWLKRAVQSALDQSHRHVEVIVSDDASGDETPEVLAGIRDPRLRHHLNPSKVGVWKNWWTALRDARGEWVIFLGDDDLLAPDYISACLDLLRRHPEVSVVATDWISVRSDGVHNARFPSPFTPDAPVPGIRIVDALLNRNLYLGAALVRRSVALGIWARCEADGPAADWGLWLDLATQSGVQVIGTHATTYFKTAHGSELGATLGCGILPGMVAICERAAPACEDPQSRKLLIDRAAFSRVMLGRHLAEKGDLPGCRTQFRLALQTKPTNPILRSQFLQSWFLPGRLVRLAKEDKERHLANKGTFLGQDG